MNYIKRLQADNTELKARIDQCEEAIQDFNRLLHSSKHNGVDMHGDRSDWIATNDVLGRLGLISDALFNINQ